MEYRDFGTIGFRPSALGFGCMRLPTKGSDDAIDEPLAIAMLRHAIDEGVNYVDTAQPYHGGNSESLVGMALAGGYRDKAAVATKMPVWLVNERADLDRIFDTQRRKLRTERIDFYLLHCLQKNSWPRMRDLGVLEWLEEVKARGYIGEIGFSFHDDFDVFRDIVDGYDGWRFCQIQHNYLQVEVQAGAAGLKVAAGRGLGVIVMEPLFGGALANPPPAVQTILDAAPAKRTPADWALQWLWSQPEVSLVLSGMTTMDQVRENLASASASRVGLLTDTDRALLDKARDAFGKLQAVPCSRCGYCLPCPEGVAIPKNFALYNEAVLFGGNVQALNTNLYNSLSGTEQAQHCVQCGQCEEKCPQGIPIREWLPRVHERFTSS